METDGVAEAVFVSGVQRNEKASFENSRRNILGRWTSRGRGPKARMNMECSRNRQGQCD